MQILFLGALFCYLCFCPIMVNTIDVESGSGGMHLPKTKSEKKPCKKEITRSKTHKIECISFFVWLALRIAAILFSLLFAYRIALSKNGNTSGAFFCAHTAKSLSFVCDGIYNAVWPKKIRIFIRMERNVNNRNLNCDLIRCEHRCTNEWHRQWRAFDEFTKAIMHVQQEDDRPPCIVYTPQEPFVQHVNKICLFGAGASLRSRCSS